jgi:hypothetical protein
MMNSQKPTLVACLVAVTIGGPFGCTNQQSMTPPDNLGMDQGI